MVLRLRTKKAPEGLFHFKSNKSRFLLLFGGLHLVADHTTNSSTADGANWATAGQYATGNGANASADSGVFVLVGHAGAAGDAQGSNDEGGANSDLFDGLHENLLMWLGGVANK
jgi:hypothetical protein